MKKIGSTRTGYKIGKYFIKFPTFYSWKFFLKGIINNLEESYFYKYTMSGKLAPVSFKFLGGFFIIMPYCKDLTIEEWFEFYDSYEEWIKEKDFQIPVEKKISSFGWYNGKIIARDYH